MELTEEPCGKMICSQPGRYSEQIVIFYYYNIAVLVFSPKFLQYHSYSGLLHSYVALFAARRNAKSKEDLLHEMEDPLNTLMNSGSPCSS